MDTQINEIARQTRNAIDTLLCITQLAPGQAVVIGCSTSEVTGNKIGTASNIDIANAMMKELLEACRGADVFLCVQCCEHLNRALVVEAAYAEKHHLDVVNVHPALKAGGALATAAMAAFDDPVVVEHIRADAGLDVGDTIIGMHLKDVVVPVRTEHRIIGQANVVMARTRSKFIGGPRAQYDA